MTRRERIESLVGAGIVLALIVGAFAVTVIGKFNPLLSREKIYVLFDDVDFLDKGSVVRIAGYHVGLVEDLELRDHGVLVTLAVDPGITMHPDHRVLIRSLTLLGGRYVEVERGNQRRPPIRSSPEHPLAGGVEPSATGIVDALRDVQPQLDAAFANVDAVMQKLDEAQGTLGKLMSDDELVKNLRNAMTRFEIASDQIRRMTARAESAGGLVARMSDPRLQGAIESARERIGAIAEKVRSGAGPLGALVADERLSETMRTAGEHLGAISDALSDGQGSFGGEKLSRIADNFSRTADSFSTVAEGLGTGKGPLAAFASDETQATLARARDNLQRFSDRPETATLSRFSRDPKLLAELERAVRDYGEASGDAYDANPLGSVLQGQIRGLFDRGITGRDSSGFIQSP
jgi:ABC-type transporter Mla subunit MlaD